MYLDRFAICLTMIILSVLKIPLPSNQYCYYCPWKCHRNLIKVGQSMDLPHSNSLHCVYGLPHKPIPGQLSPHVSYHQHRSFYVSRWSFSRNLMNMLTDCTHSHWCEALMITDSLDQWDLESSHWCQHRGMTVWNMIALCSRTDPVNMPCGLGCCAVLKRSRTVKWTCHVMYSKYVCFSFWQSQSEITRV